MSTFKNEFRLRFQMTIDALLDTELKGEGCYNLSKFLMIAYEVMELKGSAKLAGICAGLLKEFTTLAKHYNPNGDAPLRLSADYIQRLRRMFDSVDKLIADTRLTEMELAGCAIKIGEILQDHEIKHGMLPAQDAVKDAAGKILAGGQTPDGWVPDDVLMDQLPPGVASKIAAAGGIPTGQMAAITASNNQRTEVVPGDFKAEGW